MSSAPMQYLAVVFTADFLSVVLWQYRSGTTTILTQSKNVPIKSWKLNDINSGIDTALDELGDAGLTIKHVLFGVPNNWLENNSLQSDKKQILKRLTQDLLLEPLGYVVNSDALAAAQRDATGQPFNGSFISSTQHFIEVEKYEFGNLVQAERIGRSGEIAQDVAEFTARFPDTKKTVRTILIGGNDQKELIQALDAKRSSPLENIPIEQAVKMIVQAGGAETLQAQTPEVVPEQDLEAAEPVDEVIPTTDDEGGFALPAFLQTESPKAETPVDGPLMNTPRFVVHGAPEPSALAPIDDEVPDEEETVEPLEVFAKPKKKSWKMPVLSLPKLPNKKGGVIIGIVAVLLLAVGGSAAAFFSIQQSAKAIVTVWIQSETLKENQSFLVITGSQTPSATQSSILAESFTESVVLDKEVPATGTKVIGDPAKGKITLYNRTTQEKSFPQGTKLTSGKLAFTLDSEVKVASASGGNNYSVIPGTKDATITASAIGPESNLDKDKEFTIANFDTSSYVAKNPDQLAGGSSREIQAVSKKDVDSASSDLMVAASSQLKEKIEAQSTEESPVLFGQQVKIKQTDTSAKIGDEQKFVKVTLTVEAQGLRIPKAELERVATAAFSTKLTNGQQIQPGKISIKTESVSGNVTNLQLQAVVSAQVLPEVSASALKEKITAQYIPRAEILIKETPGVARSEIKLEPAWLAPFMRSLPKKSENINFNMRIQDET